LVELTSVLFNVIVPQVSVTVLVEIEVLVVVVVVVLVASPTAMNRLADINTPAVTIAAAMAR
jgi:hypothetical protein